MAPPPPPSKPLLRRVISYDTALSERLHNLTQAMIPRPFLQALEFSGDGRFFLPLAFSLHLSPLSAAFRRLFLLPLLLGLLLDLLVVAAAKILFRRQRPAYNRNMLVSFSADHWSFPSGHASRVCFVASLLFLSTAEIEAALGGGDYWFGGKVGPVVWGVWAWAVATSVSRVLLGRHFVLDVVVGACLGVVEGLLVFRYLKY